jgi:hypothetical protein
MNLATVLQLEFWMSSLYLKYLRKYCCWGVKIPSCSNVTTYIVQKNVNENFKSRRCYENCTEFIYLDFTNQLYLLAEAFKKYEVKEVRDNFYRKLETLIIKMNDSLKEREH